jgi:hypothetical protein
VTISVLQETGIQAFGLLPSESSAFGSSVTAGSSIQVNCLWANNYWPATATCADTANGSFGSAIQSLTNGTIGTVSSWKYDNSAAGADTPTVTFSASTGYIVLSAQEIGGTSGYDTSAAWNYQTSVATSANAVTSSSATPSSSRVSRSASRSISVARPRRLAQAIRSALRTAAPSARTW